ncbi:MAG: hypothetical protein L0H73_15745 [Nitrococcus sp.]|nr:hypothetical protein [Nitrococcus sp.]
MNNEQLKTVEMTRRIRDQMYEETKDLGTEEIIQYIKRRSAEALRKVEACGAIVLQESSRIPRR